MFGAQTTGHVIPPWSGRGWGSVADLWELTYKHRFTEEQLEAIGEVVYSPTYYA